MGTWGPLSGVFKIWKVGKLSLSFLYVFCFVHSNNGIPLPACYTIISRLFLSLSMAHCSSGLMLYKVSVPVFRPSQRQCGNRNYLYRGPKEDCGLMQSPRAVLFVLCMGPVCGGLIIHGSLS